MSMAYLGNTARNLSSLRVLTFNAFAGPPTPTKVDRGLEGSKRLSLQVDKIRELAPDVVCLQEVQSDGVRKHFEANMPEYAATYVLNDELRCRIGKLMRKALDSAGAGPQTTISGFLLGPVQAGLMILHRRDTLVADGPASAITFDDQSGDLLNAFRPRGVLCAHLRLRADNSRIVVANTHANSESASQLGGMIFGAYSTLPSVPLSSTPRRNQLNQLFVHASRLSLHSRVVVCGDLNSAPELGEIPANEHRFIDATAATAANRQRQHGGTPWLHSWDGTRNPLVAAGWLSEGHDARTQLDYIFAAQDAGLEPEEVSLALDDGPIPLSDHFGVLARFGVHQFRPQQSDHVATTSQRRQMPKLPPHTVLPGGEESVVWGI
jgi:endonuclease/exonuclease/phosphatase family metal-dependent hydrolase